MRDKNTPLPKTDAKLVELEYLVMENLGFVVIDKQELSLLSEKERTLRKLLENRPKCETCPSEEKNPDGSVSGCSNYGEDDFGFCFPMRKWFGVFVREFEGLSKLLCERPALENGEEPALRKEKENRAIK